MISIANPGIIYLTWTWQIEFHANKNVWENTGETGKKFYFIARITSLIERWFFHICIAIQFTIQGLCLWFIYFKIGGRFLFFYSCFFSFKGIFANKFQRGLNLPKALLPIAKLHQLFTPSLSLYIDFNKWTLARFRTRMWEKIGRG